MSFNSISAEFKQGLWPCRKLVHLDSGAIWILHLTSSELENGWGLASDTHWVSKDQMPTGSAPGWDKALQCQRDITAGRWARLVSPSQFFCQIHESPVLLFN